MVKVPFTNWIFFVLYAMAMMFIGYLGYRKTKTGQAFSIANQQLPLWVTMPLFGAAFASAASFLGYTGFAYRHGWAVITVFLLGCAGGWLLLQIFSLKLRRNVAWHSYADMMAARFESPFLRGWMATFNIAYMMIFISISMIGAGKILRVFLGLDYHAGVLLLWVVFMVYTISGGMFSVGWANVIQWIVMLMVAVVVSVGGLSLTGGISNLNASLANISPSLLTADHEGMLSALYIIGVFVGMCTSVSSSLYYHRIAYAAKTRRIAGSTYGFTAVIMMFFYFGLTIGGIAARVLSPDLSDPEFALPTLTTLLHPMAGAFVAAGIISALHSTIDNQLLSAAVMGSHDLYQKLYKPCATEREMLLVGRISTLLTGIGALIIALWNPSLIISIYLAVIVFTVPCTLFPLLVVGLYWKRATREAAILGSLFGSIGAVLWYSLGKYPAPLVIMPAAFILMIVISYWTKPPPESALEGFF